VAKCNASPPSRFSRKSLKNLILTRKKDFERIYAQGRRFFTSDYVICYLQNDSETDRFGFTVSKKIGNAVRRNKVKRRLREVVRNSLVSGSGQSFDIILIARKGIENTPYKELLEAYRKFLKKLSR